MRYPIQKFLLSTALLCALGAMAYAQAPTPAEPQRTVQNFVPVTDAADVSRQLCGLGL